MSVVFERIERRDRVITEAVTVGTSLPTVTTETDSTTRYRVTGVGAVRAYADDRGLLYVPQTVIVRRAGRGPSTVTVIGRQQLKGGGLGVVERELHRYSWRRDNWPEWLIEIVKDSEQ